MGGVGPPSLILSAVSTRWSSWGFFCSSSRKTFCRYKTQEENIIRQNELINSSFRSQATLHTASSACQTCVPPPGTSYALRMKETSACFFFALHASNSPRFAHSLTSLFFPFFLSSCKETQSDKPKEYKTQLPPNDWSLSTKGKSTEGSITSSQVSKTNHQQSKHFALTALQKTIPQKDGRGLSQVESTTHTTSSFAFPFV